jgi:virginiamycin B lyase
LGAAESPSDRPSRTAGSRREAHASRPTPHRNNIGRITPAGAITEFPVPTPGSSPQDIVSGLDGILYFTEYVGNNIGRVTASGIFTECAIPTVDSHPGGITAGPDGNIWFTEASGNKIGRIIP